MRPSLNPSFCFCLPLLLVPLLTIDASGQAPLPADRGRGAASVTEANCREWLFTLASPEFEGRGTGQPGYRKAAEFVAKHFQSLGLQARGDDGTYFQNVPWSSKAVDGKGSYVSLAKDGAEFCRIPNERLSGSVSAAMSATGEAVLLVVTAKEPSSGEAADRDAQVTIDGLDAVDVKGKIVLVHVRAGEATRMAQGFTKFAVRRGLQEKQPAALLFVSTDEQKDGLQGRAGGRRERNPATAGRSMSPLDATFGGADFDALLAAAAIDKDKLGELPLLTALPFTAELQIKVEDAPAPAMNVWAVWPGSDDKLRDEYVVIGSHLDHLGRSGDRYFPGADDDASGTTGVMAAAQMFARNKQRPARSVLFVCFSAEEVGLNGSRHFANNCPIPLSSIVAELQMDMIGRDEEEAMDGRTRVNVGETAEQNSNTLHLVGTQQLSSALHTLCLQKNEAARFDLEFDQESLFRRSDHFNFAIQGVPIAFFFTGLHRDYHQTTDTPDKIRYDKLLRVATYVYDIAFELANQPGRPAIERDAWKKFRGDNRNRPPEQPAAPLIDADK